MEGITDADYQRVQPYVEAAQAFAQTTYQSIYIIDDFRKDFLYVSDNPLFLCGHTADEVRQMGYGFYPISTNHQCSKHPRYALWN